MAFRKCLPGIGALALTLTAPVAIGYRIFSQSIDTPMRQEHYGEEHSLPGEESPRTLPGTTFVSLGTPGILYEEPEYRNIHKNLGELVDEYYGMHPNNNRQKKIVIRKSARMLDVYIGDTLLKQYPVSLGRSPVGDKMQLGDRRTPEGEFYVAAKVPSSDFYRALLVSYPGIEDAERGLRTGLISQEQHDAIVRAVRVCSVPPQNTPLGSEIEIHGAGGGPERGDWTLGCIALDNQYMGELFDFAERGCRDGEPRTAIAIVP